MRRNNGHISGGVGKVYAVKRGRKTGIFDTWNETQLQVSGFSGAQHKSFKTRMAAEAWLQEHTQVPAAQHNSQAQPRPAQQHNLAPQPGSTEHDVVTGFCMCQHPRQQQQHVTDKISTAVMSSSTGITPVVRHIAAARAEQTYTVAFDGGARGNPGRAGSGAAIIDKTTGRTIAEVVVPLGLATNNVAEYQGLIHGLKEALKMGVRQVCAMGDSELVVKQVNGVYQCKDEKLKKLLLTVQQLKTCFTSFSICHVLREYNKLADALSNEAMDMRMHQS